jgi:hypothetical protein
VPPPFCPQLRGQASVKAELGQYLQELEGRCDEAGEKLVDLRALHGQVEQLLAQRRSEYASLQGWLGPRRFEGEQAMLGLGWHGWQLACCLRGSRLPAAHLALSSTC